MFLLSILSFGILGALFIWMLNIVDKKSRFAKLGYLLTIPMIPVFLAGAIILIHGAHSYMGQAFLADSESFVKVAYEHGKPGYVDIVVLKREDGKTMKFAAYQKDPNAWDKLMFSTPVGGIITLDEIVETQKGKWL